MNASIFWFSTVHWCVHSLKFHMRLHEMIPSRRAEDEMAGMAFETKEIAKKEIVLILMYAFC